MSDFLTKLHAKPDAATLPLGLDAQIAALRTQKARGILELQLREKGKSIAFRIPKFHIFQSRPTSLPFHAAEYFARPCPETPQHGFADSCACKTLEEIQAVWDAGEKADPKCEMILMEIVHADYSAIWASGSLTIGTGNDGATSGHDTVLFPTVDQPPIPEPYKTVKESPFFEFVKHAGEVPSIVQMRDGPSIPKVLDFVPHKDGCSGENLDPKNGECLDCGKYYKVQSVVHAEGDLIEWKSIAEKLVLGKKGVCVEHVGGKLSSHYAVHCILNKVPILTSHKPKVGELLAPVGEVKRPCEGDALLEGVRIGMHIKMDRREAALVMLATLHNSAAMDLGDRRHARWLGAGIGLAIRLGFTASIGEYRHMKTFKQNGKVMSRQQVFDAHWDDFEKLRKQMRPAQLSFMYEKWPGSFGGKKWADCLASTVELWNACCAIQGTKKLTVEAVNSTQAIKWVKGKENPATVKESHGWQLFEIARKGGTLAEFYKYALEHKLGGGAYLKRLLERGCIIGSVEMIAPTEDEEKRELAKKAIEAFNRTVNVVHNGGFYLNKFVSKDYFDMAAGVGSWGGNSGGTARTAILAMEALYRIAEAPHPTQSLEEMRKLWVPGLNGGVWDKDAKVPKVVEKVLAKKKNFIKAGTASAPHPFVAPAVYQPPQPKKLPANVKITAAQALVKNGVLHVQFQVEGEPSYQKTDVTLTPQQIKRFNEKSKGLATVNSLAGSDTQYVPLHVFGKKLYLVGADGTQWLITTLK